MMLKLYLYIAASVLLYMSEAVSVSDTLCQENNENQCANIANAECDNANNDAKCKCSDGYKEDSVDDSTCVKVRVSETTCEKDVANQCADIANAECNNANTDAKCKCSDGFKEDSSDGSTCVKVKVSETACEKGEENQCAGIDNAECNNEDSDAKCKCSDGFKEDSGDGNTCVKVLGSECTGTDPCTGDENSICMEGSCACAKNYEEKNDVCTLTVGGTTCTASGEGCDDIGNAECDTDAGKCKCSPGYVMNVDDCAVENAANTMGYGTVTLVILLFLTVINILG